MIRFTTIFIRLPILIIAEPGYFYGKTLELYSNDHVYYKSLVNEPLRTNLLLMRKFLELVFFWEFHDFGLGYGHISPELLDDTFTIQEHSNLDDHLDDGQGPSEIFFQSH